MFRPAQSPRRLKCAHPLAFFVSKNNGSFSLTFRITRQLAFSAEIKPGEAVRIDIGSDSDAGSARFSKVLNSSRHWHSKSHSNQSLYLTASWSGDLAELFPDIPKVTALEVLDISRTDGITFKLPS